MSSEELTTPLAAEEVSTVQKFLFDRDFGEPEVVADEEEDALDEDAEPAYVAPTFSEDELDAARDEAFLAGKEEGIREAAEAMERKLHDATQALCDKFSQLFDIQKEANVDNFSDAINVATAISRKFFPRLNEEHGLAEIERVAEKVIPQILEEPRVLIHLHPDLKEPFSDRLAPLTHETSFEGRIVIMEDEDMEVGDCRIEWSDGRAERDLNVIWQQIDSIVEENSTAAIEAVRGRPDSESETESHDLDNADFEAASEPESQEPPAEIQQEAAEPIQDTAPSVQNSEMTEAEAEVNQNPENIDKTIASEELSTSDDTPSPNQPDLPPTVEEQHPPSPDPEAPMDATLAHLEAGPASVEADGTEGILPTDDINPDGTIGDENPPPADDVELSDPPSVGITPPPGD